MSSTPEQNPTSHRKTQLIALALETLSFEQITVRFDEHLESRTAELIAELQNRRQDDSSDSFLNTPSFTPPIEWSPENSDLEFDSADEDPLDEAINGVFSLAIQRRALLETNEAIIEKPFEQIAPLLEILESEDRTSVFRELFLQVLQESEKEYPAVSFYLETLVGTMSRWKEVSDSLSTFLEKRYLDAIETRNATLEQSLFPLLRADFIASDRFYTPLRKLACDWYPKAMLSQSGILDFLGAPLVRRVADRLINDPTFHQIVFTSQLDLLQGKPPENYEAEIAEENISANAIVLIDDAIRQFQAWDFTESNDFYAALDFFFKTELSKGNISCHTACGLLDRSSSTVTELSKKASQFCLQYSKKAEDAVLLYLEQSEHLSGITIRNLPAVFSSFGVSKDFLTSKEFRSAVSTATERLIDDEDSFLFDFADPLKLVPEPYREYVANFLELQQSVSELLAFHHRETLSLLEKVQACLEKYLSLADLRGPSEDSADGTEFLETLAGSLRMRGYEIELIAEICRVFQIENIWDESAFLDRLKQHPLMEPYTIEVGFEAPPHPMVPLLGSQWYKRAHYCEELLSSGELERARIVIEDLEKSQEETGVQWNFMSTTLYLRAMLEEDSGLREHRLKQALAHDFHSKNLGNSAMIRTLRVLAESTRQNGNYEMADLLENIADTHEECSARLLTLNYDRYDRLLGRGVDTQTMLVARMRTLLRTPGLAEFLGIDEETATADPAEFFLLDR